MFVCTFYFCASVANLCPQSYIKATISLPCSGSKNQQRTCPIHAKMSSTTYKKLEEINDQHRMGASSRLPARQIGQLQLSPEDFRDSLEHASERLQKELLRYKEGLQMEVKNMPQELERQAESVQNAPNLDESQKLGFLCELVEKRGEVEEIREGLDKWKVGGKDGKSGFD